MGGRKNSSLRDGHAQHAEIELCAIQAPAGQELPGDMGGVFHAVQVGQAALPPGEGGGPVATVGDVGLHHGY